MAAKPKKSKRERRVKFMVYIMIIAMLLSTFTYAFSLFI
ncbi:stressosome-associated protein Prli42 [Virgibacillus sediminis]|uniref:Stressosome-associated protein Prli42 n=1 Tax=Virgibacillus sediminis TaxID=202260 RepID=A0ABV7A596_9BACI